jgi:hypothetical protein
MGLNVVITGFFILTISCILIKFKCADASVDTHVPTIVTFSTKDSISSSSIKDYLIDETKLFGLDTNVVIWIVSKESQFDPNKQGDDNICNNINSINYKKRTVSRGLFQISSCYHPEISDACAYNIKCATQWSLQHMADGYINEWSTYRFRNLWYKDFPN